MAGEGLFSPSATTTTTTTVPQTANSNPDSTPTPSTSTSPPANDGPSSSSPVREPAPEHVENAQQNGDPNGTDMRLVEIGDGVDFLNGTGDMNGMDHVMGEIVDMNGNSEDVHGWSEGDNHELKRVKVYELIGSRWVDQGTAFCSGHYDEQLGEAALVARSENDFDTIILKTTIRPNDVYQRQQETLIVWTEPNGVDYALSFQDPEGCAEVWSFIMEVQPHIQEQTHETSSPTLPGSDPSVTTAQIIRSGHLPTPQLGIISEIEKAIRALARTPTLKDRVCEYIISEEYVKQMVDTMAQAEDLESLENLHALCSLMQTILTLNDHTLFEHVLEDEIFLGVVGMLEYDPEFPTYKANYREFLQQVTRFHEPIELGDPIVQKKVHGTYRLQFLKDVVLARALDDSTFNVLSSLIIFNQIDIIQHIQNDARILERVVAAFTDERTARGEPLALESISTAAPQPNGSAKAADGLEPERRWDRGRDAHRCAVLMLVQQLCAMGKNVQLPARIQLFKSLAERGLAWSVQWALSLPERDEEARKMMAAAGEVLTALLDHALDGVREFVWRRQLGAWDAAAGERAKRKEGEGHPKQAETLLLVMCRTMARSRDLAVQSMLGDALKVMLELPPAEPDVQTVGMIKIGNRPANTVITEHFFEHFYTHCASTLFAPLHDVPEFQDHNEPVLLLSREKTNLYLYLCDFLSNFILQHHRLLHTPLLVNQYTKRIATLLTARDKHLRLGALRVFRVMIKMNNQRMMMDLHQSGVLEPILDLTLRESNRDNLLSASCQELFEFLRKENQKALIHLIMTRYEIKVRRLAASRVGGPRFEMFIRRWEMNKDSAALKATTAVVDTPQRRVERERLERESEDAWMLGDDADEGGSPGGKGGEPIPPVANSLKRKRGRSVGMPVGRVPARAPPTTAMSMVSAPPRQPQVSLVDYTDEDEDDAAVTSDTESAGPPHPSPSPSPGPEGPRDAPGSPPTRRPTTRQADAKPLKPLGAKEDEDDALDVLAKASGPAMKRRRDEDEETLERLAGKTKRTSLEGNTQHGAATAARPAEKGGAPAEGEPHSPTGLRKPAAGAAAKKEEGVKKIKLKFGPAGLGVAGATPVTAGGADPGTKDGDTG